MSTRTFQPGAAGAVALLGAVALFLSSCDGGSSGGSSDAGPTDSPQLSRVTYGRLVDLYAYRRIDPGNGDRRDSRNRRPVLIETNVVVDPTIEGDELFDSTSQARPDADYRYLPFDVSVGHDKLMILWDDQTETTQFQGAFRAATDNLVEVPAAFRGQNVLLKPMPVIPRNAAIALEFSAPLGLDEDFFRDQPEAVQLLRFRDDPAIVPPTQAFEPTPVRIVPKGSRLILDTTIIGGEAVGRRASPGLAPSPDTTTANYRIAIPTSGVVSRLLRVGSDPVADLNGVDSTGETSVIRDFRSGNDADAGVGALTDFDPPALVAQLSMGILDVQTGERIVRINKRFPTNVDRSLAIRGRLPFVDGVVSPETNLPLGGSFVPLIDENGNRFPLPHGDLVVQTVVSPIGETVTIRAEVIEVLDVGVEEGDPRGPGLTANGTDGGELAVVQVRLSTVQATDSAGNVVMMEGADDLGADCTVTVRYYENIRYADGGNAVSDAGRRNEFIRLEPPPVDANGLPLGSGDPLVNVNPEASLSFRFSEPIDVQNVSTLDNLVLTTEDVPDSEFQLALGTPKSATLNFLQADKIDQRGDGTELRIKPRLGLFHENGEVESYWVHMDLLSGGVRDLGRNTLDIFDRRPPGSTVVGGRTIQIPLENLSIPFDLDRDAANNLVANVTRRFEDADEDGTDFGSVDFFGQFQLSGGRLSAANVSRRNLTADSANLGSIQRWDKGECVNPGNPMAMPPVDPFSQPPAGTATYATGALYNTPSMVAVQQQPPLVFQPPPTPQPFGGIVEPHTARGSRAQLTYREDDFGLAYRDANDLNIDVEQLHWAPWSDQTVLFDQFDRYKLRLGHSRKRPDLLYFWHVPDPMAMPPEPPAQCAFDCLSLYSSLSPSFENNVLENSELVAVVNDKEYVVNPNEAFRAPSGIKYVPFPRFERTFTWRDSRIVSWDMRNDRAIGLGGSLDASSDPPDGDRTASVSSPWVPDDPTTALISAPNFEPINGLVRDRADFLGERSRDHDPIALPLLVDISVWPDDTRSVATAGNLFHIAYIGPIWTPISPGGYYNLGGGITTRVPPIGPDRFNCTNIDWPWMRVYSFGGPDPNSVGEVTLVDPDQELTARGGVIKDLGVGDPITGLALTKPGDSHLHWAQIDLIRRVSMMTFGFVDTVQPNRHALAAITPPLGAPLPPASGRPDFTTVGSGDLRISDLVVVTDPPDGTQPGGTQVTVELRAAQDFDNSNALYDPTVDDTFDGRANLLNPNYACEAYRYAMDNPGLTESGGGVVRVSATGLTPYVTQDNLDMIRDPVTGLLPRYMNWRIVMENNIQSSPTVTPSLSSFAIVYRMRDRAD